MERKSKGVYCYFWEYMFSTFSFFLFLHVLVVRLLNHLLHALLPPSSTASQRYNLRHRAHSLQLPQHSTQLSHSHLLTRMLFILFFSRLAFFFFLLTVLPICFELSVCILLCHNKRILIGWLSVRTSPLVTVTANQTLAPPRGPLPSARGLWNVSTQTVCKLSIEYFCSSRKLEIQSTQFILKQLLQNKPQRKREKHTHTRTHARTHTHTHKRDDPGEPVPER